MSNLRIHSSVDTDFAGKLRQTHAEYSAARPTTEPDRKMLAGVKMYVCRRCQSNFRTGEGKADARTPGLGRCEACLLAAPGSPRVKGAAT